MLPNVEKTVSINQNTGIKEIPYMDKKLPKVQKSS